MQITVGLYSCDNCKRSYKPSTDSWVQFQIGKSYYDFCSEACRREKEQSLYMLQQQQNFYEEGGYNQTVIEQTIEPTPVAYCNKCKNPIYDGMVSYSKNGMRFCCVDCRDSYFEQNPGNVIGKCAECKKSVYQNKYYGPYYGTKHLFCSSTCVDNFFEKHPKIVSDYRRGEQVGTCPNCGKPVYENTYVKHLTKKMYCDQYDEINPFVDLGYKFCSDACGNAYFAAHPEIERQYYTDELSRRLEEQEREEKRQAELQAKAEMQSSVGTVSSSATRTTSSSKSSSSLDSYSYGSSFDWEDIVPYIVGVLGVISVLALLIVGIYACKQGNTSETIKKETVKTEKVKTEKVKKQKVQKVIEDNSQYVAGDTRLDWDNKFKIDSLIATWDYKNKTVTFIAKELRNISEYSAGSIKLCLFMMDEPYDGNSSMTGMVAQKVISTEGLQPYYGWYDIEWTTEMIKNDSVSPGKKYPVICIAQYATNGEKTQWWICGNNYIQCNEVYWDPEK